MKNIKRKGGSSAPGDYIYFKSQVPLHKIPVGLKQWRYYDFGPKAVPPLICIPGIAGSADVYYKQVMALSMKGYRVISVDIPRVWNHHEWIYTFEKFLDAIDVHHIHIYGTSLGGFLAQLFAQHRPRRVKSLVLSNTFLDTRSFAADMPWAPVVSWAPSFLLKRYVLTGIRDGPHEPFIADSVDFVVSQVEALSKDDLASRLTLTVDSASVGPLLLPDASITIIDTNDYCAIPQQLKDEVCERYPGARQAYLKSGGDFPFLSRPDEVNLHLQLHLRRVGVEPRPDLVRGAPKPSDNSNPLEGKKKEYDDHLPEDVAGSSREPSNSQQIYDDDDDHPLDDQEITDLLKVDEDNCKGPLRGDEREDKDDPPGDDEGNSRGPSKGNEAENTEQLKRDEEESSENSSNNRENKNADDTPKHSERSLIYVVADNLKPSCSNEQGSGIMVNCACGFPCASRTSWTHDNPRRKIFVCKFYDRETGLRGCNTFDWFDIDEPTNWQRDVINMLVAEKHRVATENHILKSRLVCAEHKKNRLAQDLQKTERNTMRNREIETNNGGVNVVGLCIVVSAVISFIVLKLIG